MLRTRSVAQMIRTAFAMLFLLTAIVAMTAVTCQAKTSKPKTTQKEKATAAVVPVGKTKTIVFDGSDDNGMKRFVLSSKEDENSATKVASIVTKGNQVVKVKALKKGTCYLRITCNGKTYAGKITVKAPSKKVVKKKVTTNAQKQAANTSQAAQQTAVQNTAQSYSDNDLYLMSHLINGEAGSNWCSDEEQRAVGSVVLNRVRDGRFPNTLQGVIYQSGQYACTWDGNFDKEPSARAIENARYVLANGSTLPAGVVFQAGFVQGEVYAKIGVHYFCS